MCVIAEERHKYTMEQIKQGIANYESLWSQMENFVKLDSTIGNIRVVHCLVSWWPCFEVCSTKQTSLVMSLLHWMLAVAFYLYAKLH